MHLIYEIVQHDGGWAYRVNGTLFGNLPQPATPRKAVARRAAAEQQGSSNGRTAAITYEDASGKWHEEVADGGDRPQTDVEG